jgi:hypothetical protein
MKWQKTIELRKKAQYNPPLSARKYKWLIMQTFFRAIFRVTFSG